MIFLLSVERHALHSN